MLGGADNPNGELPSYITGADNCCCCQCQVFLRVLFQGQHRGHGKQQPDQHHSDKYAGHTEVA
ncbi:InsB [Shigella sonnei]|nr:InsB [Shigella sonnei]